MAIFSGQDPMVITFGILGNIVSFMVYFAPAPTFYRIYKKKSTQEFQSVPYVVALLSSSLWIYYASLQSNEVLLITINLVGCFIEAFYLAIFITYAHKKARMLTLRLFVSLNICAIGFVFIFTHFMLKGSTRIKIVGWICVAMSASVFIAPLSIMKKVIRTKSVEYMPISLSLALVLSAVMWFFYGLMLKDFYIAVPNIVGLVFGVAQIILYLVYRGISKPLEAEAEKQLPTNVTQIVVVDQPKSVDHQDPTSTQLHVDIDQNDAVENNNNNNNDHEMIVINDHPTLIPAHERIDIPAPIMVQAH